MDSISILPTAWVVEPVGSTTRIYSIDSNNVDACSILLPRSLLLLCRMDSPHETRSLMRCLPHHTWEWAVPVPRTFIGGYASSGKAGPTRILRATATHVAPTTRGQLRPRHAGTLSRRAGKLRRTNWRPAGRRIDGRPAGRRTNWRPAGRRTNWRPAGRAASGSQSGGEGRGSVSKPVPSACWAGSGTNQPDQGKNSIELKSKTVNN